MYSIKYILYYEEERKVLQLILRHVKIRRKGCLYGGSIWKEGESRPPYYHCPQTDWQGAGEDGIGVWRRQNMFQPTA
jgi:hypothetical protein